jgi:hypothetical protein
MPGAQASADCLFNRQQFSAELPQPILRSKPQNWKNFLDIKHLR